MNIFQSIILGIIQGLTEFLPISSHAHLIILPWLFKWDDPGLTFDVAVHLGTLVALLCYFWEDWTRLLRAGIDSIIERKVVGNPDRRLALLLIIGTIPGILSGLLVERKIKDKDVLWLMERSTRKIN